jgi:hypothetical protein
MRRQEMKTLERKFWISLALVVLIGGVGCFCTLTLICRNKTGREFPVASQSRSPLLGNKNSHNEHDPATSACQAAAESPRSRSFNKAVTIRPFQKE